MSAAACALLAAASCSANEDPDDAERPAPTSARTSSTVAGTPEPQDPVLSPGPGEVLELDQQAEYVFTKAGRYAVRLAPDLVYEVDSPDMWEVYRGRYFSTSTFSGGTGVFSVAGPVTHAWLPAHPCRDRGRVPVGGTIRDLAEGLLAQPLLKVTRPEPVSLDAGRGLHVRVMVPHSVSSATCEGEAIALFTWRSPEPEWWEVWPGNAIHYWIVNADGQRWVLAGYCETPCSEGDVDVLARMAGSVAFEREQ